MVGRLLVSSKFGYGAIPLGTGQGLDPHLDLFG
jgi:hypothetical protein